MQKKLYSSLRGTIIIRVSILLFLFWSTIHTTPISSSTSMTWHHGQTPMITHRRNHRRTSFWTFGETLLLLDILENVPEEVRRLFRIPLAPIIPIDHSEPESGFVPHQPFEITTQSVRSSLGRMMIHDNQGGLTRGVTKPCNLQY